MKKSWEHSIVIEAPIDQVFPMVADVRRHPEWDKFTKRVELSKAGDANGLGGEWKVYEQLGLFSLRIEDKDSNHLSGLAKRVIREVVPNQRVAWHSHSIPNVGISADFSFDFAAEGSATRVTFKSTVSVPTVVERIERVVLRNFETRQSDLWKASLELMKTQAEAAYARQGSVAVAV